MWLITNFGFFSVVQKKGDEVAGTLTVRARVRADLEQLASRYLPAMGAIAEHKGTDYRYRAQAPREAVAVAVMRSILDLDYANFKDSVASLQGADRAHVYHEVWERLLALESAGPTRTRRATARPTSGGGASSYGGVLIDSLGRVLLRKPAGEFDNYVWTFAKGRGDAGDTPEETALREVLEETGYDAKIVSKIPGRYQGGTGRTEYFLMEPLGEPGSFDSKETAEVRWVEPAKCPELIRQTRNTKGRERDLKVLSDALAEYVRIRGR